MQKLSTPDFVKALQSPTFTCRFCRHYAPEGRRGGHCQKLGASMRGDWKACTLMIPTFKTPGDQLGEMMAVAEDAFLPTRAAASNPI